MEHVHIGEMLPVVETIECSLADAEVSDCLEEEVRVALRDLKYKSEQWRPFEDLHTLMLRINDHFDHANAEQSAVYNCLIAIEKNTTETIYAVKVIALVIAAVAGFWSTVAWWASYDDVRTLFNAATLFISHQLLELVGSIH
jgi:hypothetical protein